MQRQKGKVAQDRGILRLYVDVDDTLFKTRERRLDRIRDELGDDAAELYLRCLSDRHATEHEGDGQSLATVRMFCRQLDLDIGFYRGLPTVDDAIVTLRAIENDTRAKVHGYITARPEQLNEYTMSEIANCGFPLATIIGRPPQVRLCDAPVWKATMIREDWPGVCKVVIDDDPLIAMALCESAAQTTVVVPLVLDNNPAIPRMARKLRLHGVHVAAWSGILDWFILRHQMMKEP